LAQIHGDVSSEGKTAPSTLGVSPLSLNYVIHLEQETSEVKHFTVINQGNIPMNINVAAPANPDYLITSPPQLSLTHGNITIPGKAKHSVANRIEIDVAFAPRSVPEPSATILITDEDNANVSATIKLSGRVIESAQGLWEGGYQYISEFQGQALEQSGDPPANATYGSTAFERPLTMIFDPQNDLWASFDVLDSNGPPPLIELSRAQLVALKHGGRVRPKVILAEQGTTGVPFTLARSVAFDVAGDLWLSDQNKKAIMEFLPNQIRKSGSPTPTVLISSDNFVPSVIRFDTLNNLWVNMAQVPFNQSNPLQMWRFGSAERAASGASNPGLMVILPDSLNPKDLTFDSSGNMWIAGLSSHGDTIEMFPAGDLSGTGTISPQAAVTITSSAFGSSNSGSCLGGIDFDHSGDLWVSIGTEDGGCGPTQVVDFTPAQLSTGGSISPTVTIGQNSTKTNLFINGPLRFGPIL